MNVLLLKKSRFLLGWAGLLLSSLSLYSPAVLASCTTSSFNCDDIMQQSNCCPVTYVYHGFTYDEISCTWVEATSTTPAGCVTCNVNNVTGQCTS